MPLAEPIDFQISAGSLPLYFRNRAEDFPHRDRFLTVDPVLVETWRQRLSQHGGLKVGISWRAGGKANEGRKRTIELLDWRDILSVPNITFINLQYGDTVEDLAQAQKEIGVQNSRLGTGRSLGGYGQLRRQNCGVGPGDFRRQRGSSPGRRGGHACLDIVAAFAVVRWMVSGDESPWYPSVKLFRQPRRRQWEPVLAQIAARLHEVAAVANGLPANELNARIRAVRPQNEPPEAAPIAASPTTDDRWFDEKDLSSRRPLEVIAALQEQAEAAILAKNFPEAERLNREILQITPRHLKAHAGLGLIAREMGRLDHAVRCYQRALSIFEPHATNHAALAEILADLGRIDEALLHAQRAYKLDAKMPQVLRIGPSAANVRPKRRRREIPHRRDRSISRRRRNDLCFKSVLNRRRSARSGVTNATRADRRYAK